MRPQLTLVSNHLNTTALPPGIAPTTSRPSSTATRPTGGCLDHRRGARRPRAGVGRHRGRRTTSDTQFRIGSITKTMTAVLVMQCRDDGLLDLDDPIKRFVPETGYASATVRSLLAHVSGMQSEPVGPWWERSPGIPVEELLAANDGSVRCSGRASTTTTATWLRAARRGGGPAPWGRGPRWCRSGCSTRSGCRARRTSRRRRTPPGSACTTSTAR